MIRIVVTTQTASDGSLHLDLPAGSADVNAEVQVTVEPLPTAMQGALRASDLLQSGLVGMWAGRADIGDSLDFARQLRQQAQSRSRQPCSEVGRIEPTTKENKHGQPSRIAQADHRGAGQMRGPAMYPGNAHARC